MNVRYMEYIDAIAKEGNLSGAAKRLGVSQPTLSAFLSGLENDLGIDLFLRDHKRLTPTRAGAIYIRAARQIIDVKTLTYQSISRLGAEYTDEIIVGATPLRGSELFANIYTDFSRRFPLVRLSVREAYVGFLWDMVKNGEVSCAFATCIDGSVPDLETIVFSREEVVVSVPSFYPIASKAAPPGEPLARVNIRQLADCPFILLNKGASIRALSDALFAGARISPTVIFETNNNLVMRNMIRKGLGVGFCPRTLMPGSSLNAVSFSLDPPIYISPCIIVKRGRKLSEAERYLAYLSICQDRENPLYIPDLNARASEIYREFSEEEVTF